jgi:thiamine monophosphate kinase
MNKQRERTCEIFEEWLNALLDGGHEFEIVITGKRSQVKKLDIKESYIVDAVKTTKERTVISN